MNEDPNPSNGSQKKSASSLSHRALATSMMYCLAVIGCVLLIAICSLGFIRMIVSEKSFSFSILSYLVIPGLFPIGFLCLILHGYVSEYRAARAKGIVGPQPQFGLWHLMIVFTVAALVCAFVGLMVRGW